jgi:DNA-binding CsgD family transcriptional regulator
MATEVVGRDHELEAIERWLDAPRSQPPVLLIEGDAGIGKTTIWRAGLEKARGRGYRVLSCAAAGSETQLSFTALRDLLADVFDDVADELPAPQRRVIGVALLLDESRGPPPESGAIALAFLTALRSLAAHSPTLLAIDDVQWVDAASAAPLSYVLRRLDRESLVVLLAQRKEEVDQLDLGHLEPGHVQVLGLEPLTIGALGRILHQQLGVSYPRPTLHRLYEASAGNPFFALQLARALGASSAPLRPGAPLPVPATLRDLVRDRLSALPQATLEALGFLAAMARPSFELLERALCAEASSALVPALDAHVIEESRDDVRFAHPLFAAGVYDLASSARRREVHGSLAEIVSDDEERARHLALSARGPDAAIAAALAEAARGAHARIVSAELYEAAARLTPAEDIRERARRMLAAAAALFDAGDTERARVQLEGLLETDLEGPERAEAGLLLGRILAHFERWEDAMQHWREAAEATEDPAALAQIRCSMATLTVFVGSAAEAIHHADEALAAARLSSNDRWLADAHAARAMVGASAGDPSYRTFLRKALELDSGADAHGSAWNWSPSNVAAECALLRLDLEEMRREFGRLHDRGLASGDAHIELYGAYGLALAGLFAGDHRGAEELSTTVLELAETTGHMQMAAARLAAEIDAHVGRGAEARATLNALVDECTRLGIRRRVWQSRAALGLLALAEGDAAAAADELGAARQIANELGLGHAPTLLAFVDELEAAVTSDRSEQAEEALAAARQVGGSPDWGESLLSRANALVLAHRGEPWEAATALEHALELEPPSFFPLQHGRTLLLLGAMQRRARKLAAARASLGDALETFERIGAALWVDKTRAELRRIGGRTRSSGELTPAEQRVAGLVGEGKSNKEVAAELVVSVHTVEAALTSIYRKLDVRSRTELAHRLAASELSKH